MHVVGKNKGVDLVKRNTTQQHGVFARRPSVSSARLFPWRTCRSSQLIWISAPSILSETHTGAMVNKRAFDECNRGAANELKRAKTQASEARLRPRSSELTETSSRTSMRRYPALNRRVQQLREERCEHEDCFPAFPMVPAGSKAVTILRANGRSTRRRCELCSRKPIPFAY